MLLTFHGPAQEIIRIKNDLMIEKNLGTEADKYIKCIKCPYYGVGVQLGSLLRLIR
jgi:hypothetical protein